MSGRLEILGSAPSLKDLAILVSTSDVFSYFVFTLVLLNAISIGLEVDFGARNPGRDMPGHFRTMDSMFCALFSIEIAIRLTAYRASFFTMTGCRWNIFDVVVTSFQLVEEIIAASVGDQWATAEDSHSFRVGRTLRFFRLVRIVRILRLVHFIKDLNKIAYLIIGSLWPFVATVSLLLLITYILGVMLTQLVAEYGREDPSRVLDGTQLHRFYGSIGDSILSLYQAMSGGVDWSDLVVPLMEAFSPLIAVLFALYVAFAVLVICNLVTGVFVDAAQRLSKEDRGRMLVEKVRRLFDCQDRAQIRVSATELGRHAHLPEVQALFGGDKDVSSNEANELFEFLDTRRQGWLSPEDLVHGSLRLQAPARGIDVARMLRENRKMNNILSRKSVLMPESIGDAQRPVVTLELEQRPWPATGCRSSLSTIHSMHHMPHVSPDQQERAHSAPARTAQAQPCRLCEESPARAPAASPHSAPPMY